MLFKDFLFLFQTENLPLTIIVSEQDNNSGKIVYIFKDLLPKFYIMYIIRTHIHHFFILHMYLELIIPLFKEIKIYIYYVVII